MSLYRQNKTQKKYTKFNKSIRSYRPTINTNLVSLKSIARPTLNNCNTVKAFKLREPLKIAVSNNKCIKFNKPEAIRILLDRLRANKHIIVESVIPPKQIDGNCWFNVMFMMFFVSDKGRRFFHFFRQFMIEGKDSTGKLIPRKLRDAFSLLNYGVELSLIGSKYAVNMNTNNIIIDIYDNIPKKYKYNQITHQQYIPDWWDAGNPIEYYNAIMRYLDVTNVSILEQYLSQDWLLELTNTIQHQQTAGLSHLPHIIVLNGFDGLNITNKLIEFNIIINNETITYKLDSASVLNDTHKHFSCVLTCEGREMAFDGMSKSRIVPLEWKQNINKNVNWGFEGSHHDGIQLAWNFQTCYHQLIYYRI